MLQSKACGICPINSSQTKRLLKLSLIKTLTTCLSTCSLLKLCFFYSKNIIIFDNLCLKVQNNLNLLNIDIIKSTKRVSFAWKELCPRSRRSSLTGVFLVHPVLWLKLINQSVLKSTKISKKNFDHHSLKLPFSNKKRKAESTSENVF